MKRVLSVLALTALLCGTPVMAKSSAEVRAGAVESAKAAVHDKQLEVVKEAVEAVLLTQKVLEDLDKKDTEAAKKGLEKAIGKLEVVLAHENAPVLLPIDSTMTATEYLGDLGSVEETLDSVKKLLAVGKVQEARRLLDTLQSEIDIVTLNLPLVSYPQALKLAAKYLADGKMEEAGDILEMALRTLVRDEIVIPLPPLKAEALIEAARKSAKFDKKQALKHLEAAREELKIAKALGYTSASDTTYKALDEEIERVEKEIKGKNEAGKLFEKLIGKLKDFKEKSVKKIHTEKSEK
ncbi:YfdX family protein [Hydrogenimonas cancrithermarum]|uniref:YfdX protein n=1 Tax=Hydrogenimonas cancrithermarum TaxID=2993563 RepID=A0ABN6WVG9_9BACT|nr:YfdX family protein [Hydrogenimonas cancrithermarum]BDY13115.1 hypothetical protein HCR_14270 [Hydrogenimonas cancrithermarum]